VGGDDHRRPAAQLADDGSDDRHKEENGKETVAEFDPGVEFSLGLMRDWGNRARDALWPGGATQS
jgi:hypothetical protein